MALVKLKMCLLLADCDSSLFTETVNLFICRFYRDRYDGRLSIRLIHVL
jgi:hypothetical protein